MIFSVAGSEVTDTGLELMLEEGKVSGRIINWDKMTPVFTICHLNIL